MVDEGIGNWVARRARISSEQVAVIDGDQRRTYRDLERRSLEVAQALRDRGVRKGDRVAALLVNELAFVDLLFAVAKLGAILVPVNTRLSSLEVAFVLADSGADVLVWSAVLDDSARAALDLPGVRVRVRLRSGDAGPGAAEEESFENVRSAIAPEALGPVRGSDVALIMYTSGTTGEPKGAMITHDNILWNVINALTVGRGLRSTDRTITVAPLFHIAGLGVHTLPLIYAGGTVILQAGFDAEQTLEAMARHRVTVQLLVPTMWAALMDAPGLGSHDLSALERAITGSAPTPRHVLDFFADRGIPFQEGFGMSETSPGLAVLDAADMQSSAGSIGKPLLHVDVRIVGDDGREVSMGEVGELLVRGPNVFAGYWGRSSATEAAFEGDWFRTGDLVSVDEEDYLTLIDRKKDMLISGGENVYPAEVDKVLQSHPEVKEIAVIGVAHPKWGETPLAVVVPTPESARDGQELMEFARSRMAHFKCADKGGVRTVPTEECHRQGAES